MQPIRSCLKVCTIAATLRHLRYWHHYSPRCILLNNPNSTIKNGVSQIYRLCTSAKPLDVTTFEKACDETLESLTEYFEQIVEEADNLKSADVAYSSGVLTINLGPQFGTYVINRQSPNKQIWLSSPVSGPKRYDLSMEENAWVYKHDGKTLHKLLQEEISKVVNLDIDFSKCSYSKL